MKQVVRVFDKVELREVAQPDVKRGFVLVKNEWSLISTGSETRALRDSQGMFKNLMRASKSTFLKKKEISNLGYSCAGIVVGKGEDINEFSVGDRVLCSGFNYAIHAEYVNVPTTLVTKIPSDVTAQQATFATLASVSLHALRRANLSLGEHALVCGLGLTGQLLVQLLHLSGCIVIGVDPNAYKLELARIHGATRVIPGRSNFSRHVMDVTNKVGADAAFLCFDVSDDAILGEIADAVRERGKIIAVGNIKSTLPFGSLFRKEIDLVISRSFGPGRFDPRYEEDGIDYPLGYVRWTERRNIQYLLELMTQKKLVADDLISATYPLREAVKAYASLLSKRRPIAVLLQY